MMIRSAAAVAAVMTACGVFGALPSHTCIVSGTVERSSPSIQVVAHTGRLTSLWRVWSAAEAGATFKTYEPAGLCIIIR